MKSDTESPAQSAEEITSDKTPRRWLALALAVLLPWGLARLYTGLLPWGLGHFYAGHPRRARRWLAALSLGLVLTAVLLLVLPRFVGVVPAFAPFFLLVIVSWLGPALDLLRLPLTNARQPALVDLIAFGAFALAVSGIVKVGVQAMLTEAFKIPSGGMAPTLEAQDHVMVDKWHYGPIVPLTGQRSFARLPPERGDVVVFEHPDPDRSHPRADFIERVIAVGGDTLEVHRGHPIVNGWKVPSCLVGNHTLQDYNSAKSGELFVEFLGERSYLVFVEDADFIGDARQGPYRVAPGEFWVLGDNRRNSADSRSWNEGRGAGVPDAKLKGRALFVWLALSPDAAVDWTRIGINFLELPQAPRNASPEIEAGLGRCLAAKPTRTLPP